MNDRKTWHRQKTRYRYPCVYDLERAARDVVDENGVILYHENLNSNLNGYWVEAKDLQEGDVFIGANGELSTLVSKERVEFSESVNVYNFTVEGNHNYFVLAEEGDHTSLLVHNADYGDDDIKALTKGRAKGLSGLGGGLTGLLNFLNSVNPVGSLYEFVFGEDAKGEHLTPLDRGLAITGAGGSVLATVGKGVRVLNKADDVVRTLQTGGHVLDSSTLKALGLTKEQGRSAIEALKRSNKIPHNQ